MASAWADQVGAGEIRTGVAELCVAELVRRVRPVLVVRLLVFPGDGANAECRGSSARLVSILVSTRACLMVHEDSHIISAAMTTIAR